MNGKDNKFLVFTLFGIIFIVCEGFNTPRLAAESWVLNPESNTLPKPTYPAACGGVVDFFFIKGFND